MGAYGTGTLVLSDLALNVAKHTFCRRCYRGIVTAGVATGEGSEDRTKMLEVLGGPEWTLSSHWSARKPVTSTLVVGALDTRKHETVRDVVSWLRREKGVHIQAHRVHFFDDRIINVLPFKGTG